MIFVGQKFHHTALTFLTLVEIVEDHDSKFLISATSAMFKPGLQVPKLQNGEGNLAEVGLGTSDFCMHASGCY